MKVSKSFLMQANMQYFSASREKQFGVLVKSRLGNHTELNPSSTTKHTITMKLLIPLNLCASNSKMGINNNTYFMELLVSNQQVNTCKMLRNSAWHMANVLISVNFCLHIKKYTEKELVFFAKKMNIQNYEFIRAINQNLINVLPNIS